VSSADSKPRIAWVGPDPSVESSKAAYVSARLLPFVREIFEVDIICEPAQLRRLHENAYSRVFLQIEDHPLSRSLNHFFLGIEEKICCSVVSLCHDLYFQPNAESELDGQIVDWLYSSANVLFSSLRNLAVYSENVKNRKNGSVKYRGCYLPYPIDVSNSSDSVGCDNERLQIAYCGTTLLEDRAYCLLPVLSSFDEDVCLDWMLDKQELEDARRLCREFNFDAVKFHTPRSPLGWWGLLDGSVLAFHTRFSAYGDLGPYLGLSLSARSPVVVTDFAEGAHLPNEIAWKIRAGEMEKADMMELLQLWHSRDSRLLRQVAAGRSYAEEYFTSPVVASDLCSRLY